MRAKLSGPATALLIATTIGCGAATTTREDALWRTYGTARPGVLGPLPTSPAFSYAPGPVTVRERRGTAGRTGR